MEPLSRVFDMLPYFKTTLPLVESLWHNKIRVVALLAKNGNFLCLTYKIAHEWALCIISSKCFTFIVKKIEKHAFHSKPFFLNPLKQRINSTKNIVKFQQSTMLHSTKDTRTNWITPCVWLSVGIMKRNWTMLNQIHMRTGKFWTKSYLEKKTRPQLNTIFKSDGKEISDPVEVANRFARFTATSLVLVRTSQRKYSLPLLHIKIFYVDHFENQSFLAQQRRMKLLPLLNLLLLGKPLNTIIFQCL